MYRSSARVGAVLVSALLALSLTGCGGSSKKADSGPTTDPAVLKYRSDATAICKASMAALEKYATDSKVTASSSAAKQDAVFTHVGQGFLDEETQLRTLTPPPSIATQVTTWLGQFHSAALDAKKNGRKLVKEKKSPFANADAGARALQIPGCASGGQ